MTRRQTGFSLIEALLALLVLSIGCLGLAKLQALLSIAAMNRSSAAFAQLIQSDYYEKTISYDISRIQTSAPSNNHLWSPTSAYDIRISRSADETLRSTDIRIEWDEIGATRSETIALTVSNYPTPQDTRWLLESP